MTVLYTRSSTTEIIQCANVLCLYQIRISINDEVYLGIQYMFQLSVYNYLFLRHMKWTLIKNKAIYYDILPAFLNKGTGFL